MKKMFFAAIVALFAVTTVSAQTPGNWAVGPKIGVYTNTGADGAIFGIGASGRYSFTDNWRMESGIMAICKKFCSVDISADVQYLFNIAPDWHIYPQAGLSANDIGGWSCGINLGGGADFSVARNWDLSAGFKWMIQTTDSAAVGDRIGLALTPDDIHVMAKSVYSGTMGDYSSFSDEMGEDMQAPEEGGADDAD